MSAACHCCTPAEEHPKPVSERSDTDRSFAKPSLNVVSHALQSANAVFPPCLISPLFVSTNPQNVSSQAPNAAALFLDPDLVGLHVRQVARDLDPMFWDWLAWAASPGQPVRNRSRIKAEGNNDGLALPWLSPLACAGTLRRHHAAASQPRLTWCP
jgi:hypothetical protein